MNKYKNLIIVILLIFSVIGSYLFSTKESVNHSDLFALKEECSEKAQKYATDNTQSSTIFNVHWKLLHSDYVVEKKSCFAEFRKSFFTVNTGKSTEYL